jgi:hypothetical protein
MGADKLSNGIAPGKIAAEMLEWLILHSLEYADASETIYRIHFPTEALEECPQALWLQRLYAAVSDTGADQEAKAIKALDAVVARAKDSASTDQQRLHRLFCALVSTRGPKLPVRSGGKNRPTDGAVSITDFTFDNAPIVVRHIEQPRGVSGKRLPIVQDEVEIPEGFVLELELAYRPET